MRYDSPIWWSKAAPGHAPRWAASCRCDPCGRAAVLFRHTMESFYTYLEGWGSCLGCHKAGSHPFQAYQCTFQPIDRQRNQPLMKHRCVIRKVWRETAAMGKPYRDVTEVTSALNSCKGLQALSVRLLRRISCPQPEHKEA
jgi:hypothetical protein